MVLNSVLVKTRFIEIAVGTASQCYMSRFVYESKSGVKVVSDMHV